MNVLEPANQICGKGSKRRFFLLGEPVYCAAFPTAFCLMRCRTITLISLLSLSCLTIVRAQDSYTLPADDGNSLKQKLRSQYLQNDTAQAIINLYGRRQGGGVGWITSSTLAALRIATAGGSTIGSGPYAVQQEGPGFGEALLVATPFMGYGISKLVRFSNSNLEKTLTAYGAGQPLPAGLRRRLKPRFFNQPIIQYKTIPVVPAK